MGGNNGGRDEEENKDMEDFKCDVCGRLLMNKQGLGGLKRVHAPHADQVVVPDQGNYRFDLNHPPSESDESDGDP